MGLDITKLRDLLEGIGGAGTPMTEENAEALFTVLGIPEPPPALVDSLNEMGYGDAFATVIGMPALTYAQGMAKLMVAGTERCGVCRDRKAFTPSGIPVKRCDDCAASLKYLVEFTSMVVGGTRLLSKHKDFPNRMSMPEEVFNATLPPEPVKES